jgi:hypothetical protein
VTAFTPEPWRDEDGPHEQELGRNEALELLRKLVALEYPERQLTMNHPSPRGQAMWTMAHDLIKREKT